MLLVNRVDPVRAKERFAFFDKVGDEGDDRRNFSAAKLGDFLEGAPLLQQFQGFLRRARGLGMPFLSRAFAIGKSAKCVEDFFAIEFTFLFAHAGNLAKFGDGAGLRLADGVEGGVVENDEGGDHLLAGSVSAPFAEEFPEFFIDLDGRVQFVFGGFEDAVGILDWPGRFGCGLVDAGQPFRSTGADIADFAAIPFRGFAEMIADLFLPAFLCADKLLDVMVSLPGAVFFLGVADLIDKESPQTVVFLLPENVAVRGQAVAPGASGFLIELLDAFG